MNKETFSIPLIEWYQQNKRSLPFRNDNNPYSIWVSEIMAQQTQIATMLPYYNAWMAKWPTIESLAAANDQQVKKQWEGLGYYRRASNLLKGASYVMEHHQGIFPEDPAEINKIPGIGDYTTGAIASIAFHLPVPAIDGNVIRVMSRISEDDRDFLKIKNKRELTVTLKELIAEVNPSDFNQGLMELGALVCTPVNPKCDECPLSKICLAYKNGTTDSYPVKRTKTKVITQEFDTLVYLKNDQLLVSSDDSDGLMEGLLRLPQVNRNEISHQNMTLEYSSKHVYSHRIWLMDIYRCDSLELLNPKWFWLDVSEIEQASFAGAHKKIIDKLVKKNISD